MPGDSPEWGAETPQRAGGGGTASRPKATELTRSSKAPVGVRH